MGKQIATVAGGRQSALLGLGVYRPERVVTNDEICELIDSNDEWIQSRSGIRNRRFAAEDENVVTMSIEAGRKAIEASGIDPEQIGVVIVATSTYLLLTPPAAALVADALGTNGPGAFDLGGGCAGFCTALTVASDLVRGGSVDYALVVGVEKMSITTDPTDRSTRFIFGDGAGAVVVGKSDVAGIGPVEWGSDGSQADAIVQDLDWYEYITTPGATRPYIKMAGTAVFRWAAFEMGKVALRAVEKAGMSVDDLDAFVPHQANSRITEVIARSMKLPEGVPVSDDIAESGNTSAASVPLAMEEMLQSGATKPGDTALLLAFGAGLSYAAQVVTMPALAKN
ncbi:MULTISPECIES: beta-ketoacyl-ACP synthase III [Rhodococcus]|uniref:beta-ketoacyl-ACP synthase III n=1 Tax=Rhodococcus TaxID=1827 RepID=UPI000B3D1407|nr:MULTISPECIES: beta-ketoacyl-ACP synthase III [Rhodococcus]KAF0959573.1 3-oxoacyl-[acyl-carrier-protein] synthase 3 [Rhodococcus sp. T7]MBV6761400.1 ketoacyl-ACP synthase III [Rhodococcus opacus]OUS97600.1 3-oxoacyl-ACP synthase [Rhodococcus sp. NCIMB 12038]